MARAITPRTKLVFLGSPNNPTGAANPAAEILAFARGLPDHVVLAIDEAYAEYDEAAPDLRPLLREGRKVIVLKTFSKIYGLASLRIGYGYQAARRWRRPSTACASSASKYERDRPGRRDRGAGRPRIRRPLR